MNTKLLVGTMAICVLSVPGLACQVYQVGLPQPPLGYCGTTAIHPQLIGLSTGTIAAIGQCNSVVMVSSFQTLSGSGGAMAIQTQATMSCHVDAPGQIGPQINCLLSVTFGDRQIVLHIP